MVISASFNSNASLAAKAVFLTFVLSSAAFLFVGGFWLFHTYLLLTNQTTIEYYGNGRLERIAQSKGENWTNPFDLGWQENFRQTFGCSITSFRWLLPGLRPLGDGTRFPMKKNWKNGELKQFYTEQQKVNKENQNSTEKELERMEAGESTRLINQQTEQEAEKDRNQ